MSGVPRCRAAVVYGRAWRPGIRGIRSGEIIVMYSPSMAGEGRPFCRAEWRHQAPCGSTASMPENIIEIGGMRRNINNHQYHRKSSVNETIISSIFLLRRRASLLSFSALSAWRAQALGMAAQS